MRDHQSAAKKLSRRGFGGEEIAIISGSGQGWLTEMLSDTKTISYAKIAGMPGSGVKGHGNTLVHGHTGDTRVLLFNGRFHLYEGLSPEDVVFTVRLASALGIQRLLLLNSAGAVNTAFNETDIMMITDHMNFMGANPLAGYSGRLTRFLDMTSAYSPQLISAMGEASKKTRIPLRYGVYAAMMGPSYETSAEIRMLRKLGADAVGMSTVPEAIAARQEGMEVAALSIITNTNKKKGPLSHEEVLKNAKLAAGKTSRLLACFLENGKWKK